LLGYDHPIQLINHQSNYNPDIPLIQGTFNNRDDASDEIATHLINNWLW